MLEGFLDSVDRTRIHGWVRHMAHPAASVSIVVTANERLLDRTVANVYRDDLALSGIGSGKYGFDITFNPPLSPARSWLIHVRSEAGGEDIPGSPVRLQASSEFNDAARAAFSAALDAAGSDEELDGRIAFLAGERDRLLQKRADLLSQRQARSTARQGGLTPPLRALVIDQKTPEPERDGGSNALVSHMRSLQRLGYEVVFVAQSMQGGDAAAALEAEAIRSRHAPWYGSVEEVLRREADTYDVVYLHRIAVASAYITLVRQTQRRARLIFSVADLHHLRLARQAAFEDRPELLVEAERTRMQEVWAAQAADAVITHSTAEAEVLRRAVPADRVHVVTWSMPHRMPGVAFAKRDGLALIGHFAHAPNADAVQYLRDEIMPLLRREDPSILCRLVGDGLPLALQTPQRGLDYVGHVPSLDNIFDAVRLTIAPLRFGAGLKSKVMASLAAGIPCVCSPIAAEGMGLPPRLQDLVAPDAASAVRTILRLHNDEAYNSRMSKRCAAFAERAFSAAALDAALRRATSGAAATDQQEAAD